MLGTYFFGVVFVQPPVFRPLALWCGVNWPLLNWFGIFNLYVELLGKAP